MVHLESDKHWTFWNKVGYEADWSDHVIPKGNKNHKKDQKS